MYRNRIKNSKTKISTAEEFGLDVAASEDGADSSPEESNGKAKETSPNESILLPDVAESVNDELKAELDDKSENDRVTSKTTSRYDIELNVVKIDYHVERRFNGDKIEVASFDPEEHGPLNFQVTWNALDKLTLLHTSYHIPTNRLARMMSNKFKAFCAGQITKMLEFVADLFSSVYIILPDDLSESSNLWTDDVPAKVLKSMKPDEDDDEVVKEIEKRLGSQSVRKDGKGMKKQANLTVVCGQTDPEDKRSWIFFFRTHIGSAGNLLSRILSARSRKNKVVKIQSDLSSSNKLESLIEELYYVFYAGCGSHARRPFFRFRKTDEGFCYFMLNHFLTLAETEKKIKRSRAGPEQTAKIRQKEVLPVWEKMREVCRQVAGLDAMKEEGFVVWPSDTPLGQAARYIDRHYKELTAYVSDGSYTMTNNLCERLLRHEQMMRSSSKFKKGKKGRIVMDILQTMVSTCAAAEVSFGDYLRHIYKNREDVESNPELYTPYAYAKSLEEKKSAKAS